ncbi:MAG: LPXTG cell wall anchor domain-containing protein [Actinomycetota bacterium]|nr:LPXTG cell wall anchor domain-containing protein [Actinomycetota bacterium]
MSDVETGNYFDRARSIAAAFLFAAAAAAIIGSLLDWVTVEPPIIIPVEQADRVAAFTGTDANDGWFVIGMAILLILFTIMLLWRKRAIWGGGAFVASMFIGGVGVADYRGIDQIFYDEMRRIGDPTPALGLTLVAAAGFVGLIAAAGAIAATPRPD